MLRTIILLLLLTPALCSNIIIVGAGTSGCALAAKLCVRLPHTPITLLERGAPRTPEADFYVRAPRLMFTSWTKPEVSEGFPTLQSPGFPIPDLTALTGNTLGGTSSIGGMQWSVPLNGTVEQWGIKGLTRRTAAKFYDRAFKKVRPAVRERFLLTYVDQVMQAAEKAGFKDRGPFGLGDEDAIWKNLLTVNKKGRRRDSCTAYLKSAFKRCKRFKLIEGATVRKVLLRRQEHGLTAVGVIYIKDRAYKVLRAEEVILAAGPYGSPKLLQLSGVGPRKVLEQAGVRVMHELPVGERTVARPAGVVIAAYTGVPLDPFNNGTIVNSTMARIQWERGNGGPLAVAPHAFNGRLKRGDGYFTITMALGPNIGLDSPQIFSTCITNAFSEGFARIVSNHLLLPMRVQTNLLKRGDDFRRMKRCMKRMSDIHANLPPEFGIVEVSPIGMSQSAIRGNAVNGFHFVGGCRVGEVVDDELKVIGVRALRVVDSSIFNSLPASAGPMASVYMLAEFMAKKIAKEYHTGTH